MSNRDRDQRYESMKQAVPFYVRQALKDIHTCLPGIVKTYDATTRRARVQPAVDLLFTDNTSQPRAVILDVPVLAQTGGGFTFHCPLSAGDAVLLAFSERDIQRFKSSLQSGPPLSDDIMKLQHAVAVAGFVRPEVALAGSGLVLQTNDGNTYISIDRGRVTIHADNIRLEYSGGVEDYP